VGQVVDLEPQHVHILPPQHIALQQLLSERRQLPGECCQLLGERCHMSAQRDYFLTKQLIAAPVDLRQVTVVVSIDRREGVLSGLCRRVRSTQEQCE
jgi:hypothetical protein